MGLGTWSWGNQLLWGYSTAMDGELQAAFDAAVAAGVNLFDTADSYGTGRLNGRAELLLGRFIREYPGLQPTCSPDFGLLGIQMHHDAPIPAPRMLSCTFQGVNPIDEPPDLAPGSWSTGSERVRQRVRVATKFAAYPWRLTTAQMVAACRGSLRRLGADKLAVGQLHWSAAKYAPLQERVLWDGLVAMYEQGLVEEVGVSNYGPKQMLRIHDYLRARGVPLASAQVQFSLISRGPEQMDVKAICDDLGIRLISYSPLGLGMLTGKYGGDQLPKGPRSLLFRQILPGLKPLLQTMQEIAAARGKSVPQVALNWCMRKGTIPIPGAKSLEQVKDNLGALGFRLNSGEVAALDDAADQIPRGMIQNIFQTK
eukprot:SM000026S08871  [mRNA]  locus=s26:275382:278066:+ [translate_table: standard]